MSLFHESVYFKVIKITQQFLNKDFVCVAFTRFSHFRGAIFITVSWRKGFDGAETVYSLTRTLVTSVASVPRESWNDSEKELSIRRTCRELACLRDLDSGECGAFSRSLFFAQCPLATAEHILGQRNIYTSSMSAEDTSQSVIFEKINRKFRRPLAFRRKLCYHYCSIRAQTKKLFKSISNSQISLSFLFIWNWNDTPVHSRSSS